MTPITTQTLENALTAKLMVSFGKTAAEATDGEMMRASALVQSSHISTVSVVWTISIPRGMVSWPQSRRARRMASVSPVSSTSTPQ